MVQRIMLPVAYHHHFKELAKFSMKSLERAAFTRIRVNFHFSDKTLHSFHTEICLFPSSVFSGQCCLITYTHRHFSMVGEGITWAASADLGLTAFSEMVKHLLSSYSMLATFHISFLLISQSYTINTTTLLTWRMKKDLEKFNNLF